MSLDRNQKNALLVIFLYTLIGPFIGTMYTAASFGKFEGGLFFFGYAFGVLVAALAGGVSSLIVDSYINSGQELGIFTGLFQGIKSGIFTVIIFCVFILVFYGVPRDWSNKLLWFSSTCIFSTMVCGMIINSIIIHKERTS